MLYPVAAEQEDILVQASRQYSNRVLIKPGYFCYRQQKFY